MRLTLEQLKSAVIEKKLYVTLTVNSYLEIEGIETKIVEKAMTEDDANRKVTIFKNSVVESFSLNTIMTEKEKIVDEIKNKNLNTREELSAIIDFLEKLDVKDIEICEDP